MPRAYYQLSARWALSPLPNCHKQVYGRDDALTNLYAGGLGVYFFYYVLHAGRLGAVTLSYIYFVSDGSCFGRCGGEVSHCWCYR